MRLKKMGINCMSCGIHLSSNDMPFKDNCPYCKGLITLSKKDYVIKKAIESFKNIYSFEGDYIHLIKITNNDDLTRFTIDLEGEFKEFSKILNIDTQRSKELLEWFQKQLNFYEFKYNKYYKDRNK